MRVTLVVGGMNEPSNSATLAGYFAEGLKAKGVEVTIFRLKDMQIEHFALKHYKNPPERDDDYYKIEDAIKQSSAVVLAMPIWNFSVPGNLKNFIDRLGAYGLDPETRSRGMMNGMPFYFIFSGGMAWPGWTSMLSITTSHVQEGLRYFGISVCGTHFEGRCTPGKGQFGLVVDQRPDTQKIVREKGEKFAQLIETYSKTGKLPLRNEIAYRIFRFGYALVNKIVYALTS